MRIVFVLMAIVFYTASFDNFLSLNVVGTLRIAQIAMLFVIIAGIAQIIQTRRILWPQGGTALVIWCVIQGALLSQTRNFAVAAQLYMLLLYTVIGVYATLQTFGRSAWLPPLMKVYVQSYVFVAIFGLYQFVSPALHLGAPLVGMWIKHGVIPRISGFNYEPSYYATYVMIGWITVVDLRVTGARLTASRRWFWAALLLSAALFLSTSKTAWIFMLVEGLARLTPILWRVVVRQCRLLMHGRLLVPLPRTRLLVAIFAIAMAAGGLIFGISRVVPLNSFLSGTGINGNAAHSINDRTNRFNDTMTVFREHPWIGVGLGGVSGEIAALHGTNVNTLAQLRLWWGSPVPAEVLAGSGALGIIPFIWFFLAITVGQSRLMRNHWDDERAKWLHALIRGLVFEWMMLLADQNLIRVYLWFHVTMVVMVAYHLRYTSSAAQTESGADLAERLVTA